MDSKHNNRLGPDAWVAAALQALQDSGIEQVRIERLAKTLGVTKGSFYWHFKDRQELLDRLLDFWFVQLTQSVFEVAQHFDGTAKARLHAVFDDIMEHERAGYDLAVRAWARNDDKAANAVREVDAQRLAFLTELITALGFDPDDADIRANLLYCYVLGEATAFNRQSKNRRHETLIRKLEILTGLTHE